MSEVEGGEREFESHPMGERRKAAHASTVLSQETAFLSMYIMGLADMKNRSNSSKQRQFHGNALPRARGLYRSARTAFLRSNCRF